MILRVWLKHYFVFGALISKTKMCNNIYFTFPLNFSFYLWSRLPSELPRSKNILWDLFFLQKNNNCRLAEQETRLAPFRSLTRQDMTKTRPVLATFQDWAKKSRVGTIRLGRLIQGRAEPLLSIDGGTTVLKQSWRSIAVGIRLGRVYHT